MKDWYAQGIKDKIAELLKHYLLDMNESKDFDSEAYAEVDELVNNIDKLIQTRIDDALKECSAQGAARKSE